MTSLQIEQDLIYLMQKGKLISAKKNFTNVSNFKRRKLIEMVYINNYSVLEASRILDINYSTAKGILRIFRKERRIHKIKGSLEDNLEKSLSVLNMIRMISAQLK